MKRLLHYAAAVGRDLFHSASCTRGPASLWRLSWDLLLFRLIGVVPLGEMNRTRKVRLHPGTELNYRLNKGDIYSIHEIWFDEAYRIPFPMAPKLIVDLGANIGIASLWLAARYGCRNIIAMEPSSGNAAVVRKNFADNGIEGQVIEAAIAAEDGSAVFYEVASSTNGCIEAGSDERGLPPQGVTARRIVKTVSMPTLFENIPRGTTVDLLKIDIEGGEQDLLSGDVGWLGRVGALVIEFHAALIQYDALVAVLINAGFRRVHAICSDALRGNTLEVFVRGGAEPAGLSPGTPADIVCLPDGATA